MIKNKSSNLQLPFGMSSEPSNFSSLKLSKPSKIKLVYNRDDELNSSNHSNKSISNPAKAESEKIMIKVVSNSSNLNDESTKDRRNTGFPDQLLDQDELVHLNSQPNQLIYMDPIKPVLEESPKSVSQSRHVKS